MLARNALPEEYRTWNKRHGAPFGRGNPGWMGLLWRLPEAIRLRLMGCFAMQANSPTRAFEYPWAFFAAPVRQGLRVLEIGGGLSGFQFTLARAGCEVTNIDPGLAASGGASVCDPASMRRFNRLFGTSVRLINTTIERAQLPGDSFDRAYAVSVLEHLPEAELATVMGEVFRVLKPGGLFVITLDLFLNLHPFTTRQENSFGRNLDVARLCALAPFRLAQGERRELHGFAEFDATRILAELETLLVGSYPVISQCLVLEKP